MKKLLKIVILFTLIFAIYVIWDDIGDVLLKYSLLVKSNNYSNKNIQNEIPKVEQVSIDSIKGLTVNTNGLVKNIEEGKKITDQKKLSVADVIRYTNINRKENGNLVPLSENADLDHSAEIKLQDMFTNQYFEHESPSGVSVGNLAEKVKYEYITVGENLALGNFKDNKDLLDAWMASPGHRANILNTKYTEMGAAVGYGSYKGQKTWLAVQHFGTPKSICPTIDSILSQTINIKQDIIKNTSTDLKKRLDMIKSGAVYDGLTNNEQIAVYNNLVKTYNTEIKEIKDKINTYNTSVKNFNACLSAHSSLE